MKITTGLGALIVSVLAIGLLSCSGEEVPPGTLFVYFPQLKTDSGEYMEAQLLGEMVLDGYYLRIDKYLVIWRPGYSVRNNNGTIEVVDRNGEVVARVGEEIYMSGGEIKSLEFINTLIREPLPQDCEGPFWLQGEVTRLNSE